MAVGKRIASLRFWELVVLANIFLKYPSYFLPTYRATNKTLKICNKLYGDLHHKDNRANAFRHALWNYLICKYCFSAAGSVEETVRWSEKITDLHERLSPNNELAKAMDLHNNKIGRELFRSEQFQEEDVVVHLQQMTREAIKIGSYNDVLKERKKLVFIEEVQ